MTFSINLWDTKTSMQVAGYKEYYCDGIGPAAVFYSKLWHKIGITTPGTVKVDLFCGNNPLERFPKKIESTFSISTIGRESKKRSLLINSNRPIRRIISV